MLIAAAWRVASGAGLKPAHSTVQQRGGHGRMRAARVGASAPVPDRTASLRLSRRRAPRPHGGTTWLHRPAPPDGIEPAPPDRRDSPARRPAGPGRAAGDRSDSKTGSPILFCFIYALASHLVLADLHGPPSGDLHGALSPPAACRCVKRSLGSDATASRGAISILTGHLPAWLAAGRNDARSIRR